MQKEFNLSDLIYASKNVRKKIINMSTNGGAFTGAALSCADICVYLYHSFLNVSPQTAKSINRDRFFLSKGHSVPALYAVLTEFGYFEESRLKNHLKIYDDIYWHPNTNIPGIDCHSGSLGHLLSIAAGMAKGQKILNSNAKSVVLLGDGELNEGSNWEALLSASTMQLDNLIIIIDRNRLQANMETENLIPLEPLDMKLKAFGFETVEIDGHNFYDIHNAFSSLPIKQDKTTVIIANTVRGKGIPTIENKCDKWFCNFSENEVNNLLSGFEN